MRKGERLLGLQELEKIPKVHRDLPTMSPQQPTPAQPVWISPVDPNPIPFYAITIDFVGSPPQ